MDFFCKIEGDCNFFVNFIFGQIIFLWDFSFKI